MSDNNPDEALPGSGGQAIRYPSRETDPPRSFAKSAGSRLAKSRSTRRRSTKRWPKTTCSAA
ncbi:hypothetical protein ACFQL7_18195 [Halocatena marina]|uniref:Uncharacterized protein n=1 Tax=Halocatena marina TaxID=2934937 RepID=A0ABD5YQH3_9EURY